MSSGIVEGSSSLDGPVSTFFIEDQFIQVVPRERQVIDLLLQGYSNVEIAQQLHISERTVKAHFNHLFRRFDIKGGIKRVKLATLIYRRQLRLERAGQYAELPLEQQSRIHGHGLPLKPH